MINLTIDDRPVEAERGETLLEVARRNGIDIPTLCQHDSVQPYGACRLCLVEVDEGRRTRLVTSCTYPVRSSVVVRTRSERVLHIRRVIFELLLAEAPASAELAALAARHGVSSSRFAATEPDNACILCGLCQRVCHDVRHVGAISFAHRGTARTVTTPFGEVPETCDGCAACASVCPTGAVRAGEKAGRLCIEPWHSSVELLYCEECGAVVGPRHLAEAAERQLAEGMPPVVLCVPCRRKAHAHHIAVGVAES